MLAAVKKNGQALQNISNHLKFNKKFLLTAIQKKDIEKKVVLNSLPNSKSVIEQIQNAMAINKMKWMIYEQDWLKEHVDRVQVSVKEEEDCQEEKECQEEEEYCQEEQDQEFLENLCESDLEEEDQE
ncbi:hypothetical protein FDP41_004709 [Naegleria fowleri]|uniref:DUF4116 domain-containing protein n=1 Tax=Naegleria fowleri TaxID=5763 RepID=A0A6A5BMN4_NAEFO|nr:uncharacterized protein FDP41_005655 [Naegleria fowleri]XP_044560746.1 uncharacterized protein FDP41_004709 [Naegleria fowleri]KAF0975324.1 hypothetical protein FDP41_005655 [Naegleria fowleri]KAF0976033.1 hypothetical protein FDP41_004709 [Naegleria fowleri]